MIKIKKLIVDGFWLLSNSEIDFTNKEGLINLVGRNLDSFQSNGSGKSTIPNAICQALYNKNMIGKPNKEIYNKSTNTKFSCICVLDVMVDNEVKELRIERDYSKNFFEYYIEDIPSGYTNKVEKQKQLDSILGLSFNTFEKLFFLSASRSSLFSQADDSSQGKFIRELLSLEFITDINKRADLELKSLKLELEMKLKEQDNLIKQTQFLKEQLNLVKVSSFDTAELNIKIENLEEIQYNKGIKEKEFKAFNKEVKDTEKEINTLTSNIEFLKQQQTESTKVLNLKICYTCKQPISNLDDLENEAKSTQDKITELATKRKALKDNNLGKYKILKGLQTSVEEITKKEILLESDIKRLKILREQGENSDKVSLRNKLRKDLAKANDDIVNNEISLKEFRDNVYIYELVKVCSGTKGFIKERINMFIELFNGTLDRISSKALGNEINVWIEKSDKDSFELVYKENGIIQRYQDLSSGTKRRVDILLCLSLNLAIKTLTGVEINLLFLDEVLSNIDEEGKEEIGKLLRFITKEFKDKSIITVLHGETIENDFTLLVTREDNQSTIKWEN